MHSMLVLQGQRLATKGPSRDFVGWLRPRQALGRHASHGHSVAPCDPNHVAMVHTRRLRCSENRSVRVDECTIPRPLEASNGREEPRLVSRQDPPVGGMGGVTLTNCFAKKPGVRCGPISVFSSCNAFPVLNRTEEWGRRDIKCRELAIVLDDNQFERQPNLVDRASCIIRQVETRSTSVRKLQWNK